MDEETRVALAAIQTGITNLTASVALVARHQTIQGERISRILELLTPEEEEEEQRGPTTQELLSQMMTANAEAVEDLTAKLDDIRDAVGGVPSQTALTIGQAYHLPSR